MHASREAGISVTAFCAGGRGILHTISGPPTTGGKQKCGLVGVGHRLTDDLREFLHEVEEVGGDVNKLVSANGRLNLALS